MIKRNRTVLVIAIYAIFIASLMLLQPVSLPAARAQNATPVATPNLIDVYSAQATANAQATLSAAQQQQNAAQQAQAAAAAQAQAADAQAQAAAAQAKADALARQATLAAQQQQAQLAALQSTADAAALQATAIVQETRTAIEISAEQTKSALDVVATQDAQALNTKATQAAIQATSAAVQAKDRDNIAIATSVANNIEATRQAGLATASDTQRRQDVTFFVYSVVVIVIGVGCLYVGVLGLRRLAQALKPRVPAAAAASAPAPASSAALMIVDAASGQMFSRQTPDPRMPDIEDDNSPPMNRHLRQLFGYETKDGS